jgi:phosphopantetheinyl transferase (holo-ACP synthase)
MIISAGNDIVDLRIIDIQRTKDPKFYTKFITGAEIALHGQSQLANLPLEYFVWMLWSVKESVYKFAQRHNPDLVFSPSKIIIQQINFTSNPVPLPIVKPVIESKGFAGINTYTMVISFGAGVLYSRSIVDSRFIATVVNNIADFEAVYWGVKSIDNDGAENQSREVRAFLLKKLASTIVTNSLVINKTTAGCPVLFSGTSQLSIPVSLAHHGHYVAYSFLPDQK